MVETQRRTPAALPPLKKLLYLGMHHGPRIVRVGRRRQGGGRRRRLSGARHDASGDASGWRAAAAVARRQRRAATCLRARDGAGLRREKGFVVAATRARGDRVSAALQSGVHALVDAFKCRTRVHVGTRRSDARTRQRGGAPLARVTGRSHHFSRYHSLPPRHVVACKGARTTRQDARACRGGKGVAGAAFLLARSVVFCTTLFAPFLACLRRAAPWAPARAPVR